MISENLILTIGKIETVTNISKILGGFVFYDDLYLFYCWLLVHFLFVQNEEKYVKIRINSENPYFLIMDFIRFDRKIRELQVN